MSNTRRQHTTQASSASSAPKVIAVADAKTRYQFLVAISDMCLPDKVSKVATRLALHFNCKTGQCDPGYHYLMRKLGISKSTLYRALDTLEGYGLIGRKQTGPEHVNFTLYVPPTGVIQVTPLEDGVQVSDSGATGVKNGPYRCHHADTTYNSGTGKQGSAATPRAARPADRPVSSKIALDDDPDFIPLDPPGDRAYRRSPSIETAAWITASST